MFNPEEYQKKLSEWLSIWYYKTLDVYPRPHMGKISCEYEIDKPNQDGTQEARRLRGLVKGNPTAFKWTVDDLIKIANMTHTKPSEILRIVEKYLK